MCLNDEELELMSKDEVITLYHQLQDCIEDLKRRHQGEFLQHYEYYQVYKQQQRIEKIQGIHYITSWACFCSVS